MSITRRAFCHLFGHRWRMVDCGEDSLHMDGEKVASAWFATLLCSRCGAQRCEPLEPMFGAVPREPSARELLAKR